MIVHTSYNNLEMEFSRYLSHIMFYSKKLYFYKGVNNLSSNNIVLIALLLLLTSNNTINTTQLLLLLALLSTTTGAFNCLCGNNTQNATFT